MRQSEERRIRQSMESAARASGARMLPALVVLLLLSVGIASAQTDAGERGQKSAEEVAQELANPNTALGQLAFPIDTIWYDGELPGASDEWGFRVNFQPSLPVPIGPGVNFFARPLIPVIFRQPVPDAGGGFESEGVDLGDIGFDAAIGKSFGGGLVLVGGMVGSIPTATHDHLGAGHWSLGPEGLVGVVRDWGVVAALVNHSWDVGGDTDTSVTAGQYFYTINLKNAWQISAQPTFSYNHEAPEGDRLAFPLGTGLAKTVIRGKTPWKFACQYWYFAASADSFGSRHQLRFQVSAVVPLPW